MRARRGTARSAPAAPPSYDRGAERPGTGGQRRGAHAGPPALESYPVPPAEPRGDWRRLRPRTVRAKIVALLMVPVVSVMALWAFATVTTAQSVWDLLHLRDVDATLLAPVDATVSGLQAERSAAGQLLAAPSPARESALREAAAATDRAVAPLTLAKEYNRADAEGLGAEAATRVDTLSNAVAALPDLRSRILNHSVGWSDSYTAYTAAIDHALEVAGSMTALQDHQVASDSRVLLEFAQARELLAREDALLRAAQGAARFTDDQLHEFGQAVYARRLFEQTSARDLRPADRSALLTVTSGTDYQDLTRAEDAIRSAGDGRAAAQAVSLDRWAVAADNVGRALHTVQTNARQAATQRSNPYALGLFTPSGAVVLLGLIAVIASLLISVQIGRGLVTELIGLRNSALELAGRKLPATMRRLRAGEELDVDVEAPLVPHGNDDIGQVHGALDTVQRAAVTAAIERAEVLSGISGVFVNLARRSQVLVHRQLTLLDAMERRTEDPNELDDLFKLDHLTTRMRRHAEGLIILSGAAPGRAWRRPVPLTDVVRAAVAEVEEYVRVEVHPLPYAAVAGPAVADLTHLVAELVENATGFSPPHTKVRVRGEQVGNGYALEIEDRGLGMGPEALADANRRIEASEQVDLFDSDRLGLFVVSRLAKRQGVKVVLRPSAYGGTTAVVLLPTALLETRREPELPPDPDLPPVPDVPSAPDLPPVPEVPSEPEPPRSPDLPSFPDLPHEPDLPDVPDLPSPPELPSLKPHSAAQPFGVKGTDPGVLRPTPFRASGGRPEPRPALPTAEQVELPRRIRQASLAPQLREAPPRPQPRPRTDGRPGTVRNPEEVRAAMSAFQQGWARGKAQRPANSQGDTQ